MNMEYDKSAQKSEQRHDIRITTRDRLLRAWENSTELTRDFEMYAHQIDDERVAITFANFAEDEALHASKLLGLLREYESQM